MPASPSRFFTLTYFSPYYFAPLVVNRPGGTGTAAVTYRDSNAFASVVNALTDTGAFANVSFNTSPDNRPAGADLVPAAVVTPDVWVETDDSDPIVLIRRVSFLVTVLVRDDDPLARYDALDRLSCVVQNALDGTDLGGGCLADLTRTRRGQMQANPPFPEQGVVLRGEFTYLVSGLDGHNTS